MGLGSILCLYFCTNIIGFAWRLLLIPDLRVLLTTCIMSNNWARLMFALVVFKSSHNWYGGFFFFLKDKIVGLFGPALAVSTWTCSYSGSSKSIGYLRATGAGPTRTFLVLFFANKVACLRAAASSYLIVSATPFNSNKWGEPGESELLGRRELL